MIDTAQREHLLSYRANLCEEIDIINERLATIRASLDKGFDKKLRQEEQSLGVRLDYAKRFLSLVEGEIYG